MSGGLVVGRVRRMMEATVMRIMTAVGEVGEALSGGVLAAEAGLVAEDDHRAHYVVGGAADLDPVAWQAGRDAGRTEVLQWCQERLRGLIEGAGRFEPTDALEVMLADVKDQLLLGIQPTQVVDNP